MTLTILTPLTSQRKRQNLLVELELKKPVEAAESTEKVKDTKAAPVEAKKDESEKPVDENPADKVEEKENAKDDANKRSKHHFTK